LRAISQLIARKIRQLYVYTEIVPHNTPLSRLRAMKLEGIILSGGPANIYAKGAPRLNKRVLDLGVPVLGICYGMQAITVAMGGRVDHSDKREYGHAVVQCKGKDPLWRALSARQRVWMSHQDRVSNRIINEIKGINRVVYDISSKPPSTIEWE